MPKLNQYTLYSNTNTNININSKKTIDNNDEFYLMLCKFINKSQTLLIALVDEENFIEYDIKYFY